ncbi:hypothetical protein CEP52_012827 [Fusarium oligoseptatum]|uniref:Uncharacterized protein n=1 Tax=Fusarium oligoseptatum TaxID=2604345 RepID=A0A428SWH5_9HYPO|nr:hypothetical protein CEP52_012827 [Fusarium oligoseptatum]
MGQAYIASSNLAPTSQRFYADICRLSRCVVDLVSFAWTILGIHFWVLNNPLDDLQHTATEMNSTVFQVVGAGEAIDQASLGVRQAVSDAIQAVNRVHSAAYLADGVASHADQVASTLAQLLAEVQGALPQPQTSITDTQPTA